ncbi:MAG: fructose-6-phosphate aldolase [Bacillota bacterium]
MRLFLDTANIQEIRDAAALGVISGVTTNPSLVAKEGRDFHTVVREIAAIVDGPISAEALSLDNAGMVEEATVLARIHPNVVIKLPMTGEGLTAARRLKGLDIKTNVTLVFSANQALLAALAGATYVSPFVGRLDDAGHDGMEVVRDTVEIFAVHDLDTQVIAASVRHPLHVIAAAKAGADIATIPYKVLQQMLAHPLTDAGIARFLADWQKLEVK